MLKNITVVGSGTMGHSIAETFALHGYDVMLYNHHQAGLDAAIIKIKDELKNSENDKKRKIIENFISIHNLETINYLNPNLD